jgi:hypothetical protein
MALVDRLIGEHVVVATDDLSWCLRMVLGNRYQETSAHSIGI